MIKNTENNERCQIASHFVVPELDEENAFGEDELGLETDLKVSYQLLEGLSLDVIGAYLSAGDAIETNNDGKNQKDPMEISTRLSLSF